jgi:hypothetical protein
MLAMHPDCARCGADLPAEAPGAFICSLECTYCAECADDLDERCTHCGGELMDRPTRTGKTLKAHPASTEHRFAG